MPMNIAVQLYTLRDQIKKDFAGTMNQVARIGYKGIELAGFGNLSSAKDVRKAVDDAGLAVCGSHIGLDAFKDLNKVMDDNETLGNKTLVVPWIGEAMRNPEGYRKLNQEVQRIARETQSRGFVVCYHNHDFEFQSFDGKTGMDMIFEGTDPKLVKSELDLYWVARAGLNPLDYMKKLGSRLHLVHLKDMAAGPDKKFAPVGTGTLDFKSLIDAANAAGLKWGIVEQDQTYDTPPLDAIRVSFDNLKKIGAV